MTGSDRPGAVSDDPVDAGAEPVEGEQATLETFADTATDTADREADVDGVTPTENAEHIELLADQVARVVDQVGDLVDASDSTDSTDSKSSDPGPMFN